MIDPKLAWTCRALVAAALLAIASAGCTRVVRVSIDELLAQSNARVRTTSGQPFVGYTDSTGRDRPSPGKVRAIGSDSIEIYLKDREWVEGGVLKTDYSRDTIHPSTVSRLHIRKFSTVKTVGLVLSPIALLIVLFAIGGNSSVSIE